MKNALVALIAITLTALGSGCMSNGAMTEMARIQGKQANEITEIRNLIKQQNKNIAALCKRAEADAKMRAALSKAIKKKLEQAESGGHEQMLQAALLLARNGQNNISYQAISILGQLGGKKAENALLDMLNSGSYSRYSSNILNALVNMRSSGLRDVVMKFLKSGDSNEVNAAINALQNRSANILKKSDLPMLEKILAGIPDNNYNNNRYRRNNLLRAICRLDPDKGAKYICDALETADANQQRELIYITNYGNIRTTPGFWRKIIKALGEPDSQNVSAYQAACDGIARCGDWRLTDQVLPWAKFAARDNNFRNQYINMLSRMRDPKAAKTIIDLYSKGSGSRRNNSYYLRNFPGIVNNNGNYSLADAATMKVLLEKREKKIARLNAMDKKK